MSAARLLTLLFSHGCCSVISAKQTKYCCLYGPTCLSCSTLRGVGWTLDPGFKTGLQLIPQGKSLHAEYLSLQHWYLLEHLKPISQLLDFCKSCIEPVITDDDSCADCSVDEVQMKKPSPPPVPSILPSRRNLRSRVE